MKAAEIMAEIEAVETLGSGEALYYHPGTGTVELGRDGCQASNTCCLRVGPDHVDGLDLSEILAAVEGFLWRHDGAAPATGNWSGIHGTADRTLAGGRWE